MKLMLFFTTAPKGKASGFMDQSKEIEHVRQAERHVAEAKALIERQREVVAELMQKGHDTEIAESTLRAMERTLKAIESHRDLIVKDQNPSGDAPPSDGSTPLPSD
jgi:hypothetical protein